MTNISEFAQYLLNLIEYNKNNNPTKHEGEKVAYREWYDTAYSHLLHTIQPMLQENGELFVDYWLVKYLMGEKRQYKQNAFEDKHYLYISGTFGTGYLALTTQNLYIISLKTLTKKYPLYDLGIKGFGWDVFSRMQGEVNDRNPLLIDKMYKIFTQSILGAQIILDDEKSDAVDIRTSIDHILFYPHFVGDDTHIVDCLKFVSSGELDHLICKSDQGDLNQEDVIEKLRSLKILLEEEIISREEFEQKKRELLKKL